MATCIIIGATRSVLGPIARRGARGQSVDIEADPSRFVIAFCGSGTGHMTQALALCRLLQARGMTLGGVVTDTDAVQRLVDDNIKPLGAPVLVLPAITIVNKDGVLPPHKILAKGRAVDRGLTTDSIRIREFLILSRAGVIVNCWQISLGKFLLLNKLPPSVRVIHIAAQCGQARGSSCALLRRDVRGLMAAAAKGTVEVMCDIFARTGTLVPIHANGDPASGSLAPIMDIPEALPSPRLPPLLLCYFLTMGRAKALESLLHRHPIDGLEVHCFTPEELPPPKGGRQLSGCGGRGCG